MECTRIYSIHDYAITFEFADKISEEVNIQVIALKNFIEQHPIEGIIECVPAYSSLTIYVDKTSNQKQIIDKIKAFNSKLKTQNQQQPQIKIIPVCYELGIDFANVCSTLNVHTDELIQLHSEPSYRVYMIGFTPGFPYMGTVPEALEMPRKKIPSLNIEAGSVAIAGKQTGIYPRNSPGGWHVIGKTPLKMYDKKRNSACFLQAGDLVKFKPISKKEFDQHQ